MAVLITSLTPQHDKTLFDCGKPLLNMWLQQTASQHHSKRLSQTSVLIEPEQPNKILAYYALNIRGLIAPETLPHSLGNRLPLNAPALTIGRLAVDLAAQKKGYGEILLVNAMANAKAASDIVGGTFLFVDAIDDQAASFYARYGFASLPDSPLILVMPIKAIP